MQTPSRLTLQNDVNLDFLIFDKKLLFYNFVIPNTKRVVKLRFMSLHHHFQCTSHILILLFRITSDILTSDLCLIYRHPNFNENGHPYAEISSFV